jgi:hypothetical protein
MFTAIELRLLAYVLVAAGVLGLGAWLVHHERQIGADTVNAAVADQHAKDVDAARAREMQIHTDQETSNHEADRFRTAAQLDARDARDAGDRLQQRFAAVNARCLPGDPAASAGGAAADPAAGVRADVLRRVVAAARLAASAADASRAAGTQAAGAYDALTP